MTTQTYNRGGGLVNFLVALAALAMIAAFSVLIAERLGYLGTPQVQTAPVLPPTAIIREIQLRPPQPAAPAPVEQAPAVVAPAAPAPVVPTVAAVAPVVRQVIIVKNLATPGAAPVVIDRGTKYRGRP